MAGAYHVEWAAQKARKTSKARVPEKVAQRQYKKEELKKQQLKDLKKLWNEVLV